MITVVDVSTRPCLSSLQALVTGIWCWFTLQYSPVEGYKLLLLASFQKKISYHLLSGTKYQYHSNAQLLLPKDTTACILLQ